ncbi:hypothetical protein F6X40_27900 [Paraburkholderia sp. UCT31]|uniref:hypothetical protein n=1 Tax=Paraburkholderia sp. UCT31 TaxID=2615209 RepID=UPI001654D908|nr:hypothetical protein [Paraburkholderia sp. UCT31]MBC8740464.1 hypothetical protein [Paraburkholderia sp. UCT31]
MKRPTPYFIPKVAPATEEGTEAFRREFQSAVAAAQTIPKIPGCSPQAEADFLRTVLQDLLSTQLDETPFPSSARQKLTRALAASDSFRAAQPEVAQHPAAERHAAGGDDADDSEAPSTAGQALARGRQLAGSMGIRSNAEWRNEAEQMRQRCERALAHGTAIATLTTLQTLAADFRRLLGVRPPLDRSGTPAPERRMSLNKGKRV